MHNTRRSKQTLEPYFAELTRFERQNKKNKQQKEANMAEDAAGNVGELVQDPPQGEQGRDPNQRTLMEYATPGLNGQQQGIVRPPVQANNFEIKPAFLQMLQSNIQFFGFPHEDPHAHIQNFLEICDTFKYNGVSDDAIRLRLFPFTLKDRAKSWLAGLGGITTWNQLAHAFLEKYFPISKTTRIVKEITNFQQLDGESLYEAWERYKELQRSCPHHNLPKALLLQTFYSGMTHMTRSTIDAAAGGSLMRKTIDEAFDLIEEISTHNCLWPSERQKQVQIKDQKGALAVDQLTSLQAQISTLSKQVSSMGLAQNQVAAVKKGCDFCGDFNHGSADCFVINANNPMENSLE